MKRKLFHLGLLLFVATFFSLGWAQQPGRSKAPVRRASPPKFTADESRGVFFENIFDGKVLAGDRPANLASAAPAKAGGGGTAAGPANPGSPSPATPTGADGGWSKLIASSTIEDEVKAIKQLVDKNVTTPTEFAGKGYKEARRNFTVLAMLFGIIGEYDGDVRWKNDAPTARDVFARTAANAKVGTQQVFNEAKQRKGDLEDLLNSGGLGSKGSAEAKVTWPQTCDRSPLMLRLEMCLQARLQPWTASKNDFNSKKEELLHEAQIVAAIGRVLAQEGMADADAAEYKGFCKVLEQSAVEIVDAIKLNSDDAARKAVGQINKSCDDCHGSYR